MVYRQQSQSTGKNERLFEKEKRIDKSLGNKR